MVLQEMDGVAAARVDPWEDRAIVVYNPAEVTTEEMVAAVRALDFEASLARLPPSLLWRNGAEEM